MPFLSVSQSLTLACLLEATAPKVGNVHRGADFDDLTFPDFVVSAVVASPYLARAGELGVGWAVHRAVSATREAVGGNTNLGMLLLLAPLVACGEPPLAEKIDGVLEALTPHDAARVYAAIRLAEPSGLGDVREWDIQGSPPDELLAAMRAAAGYDLIAAQYANGFAQVFELIAPELEAHRERDWTLTQGIVATQLLVMSRHPDTLIARKCGPVVAQEAADRAAAVLAAGPVGSEAYHREAAEFDFWLRCDGHRRNPGTTADLLAAGLYVGLREGRLAPPFR